MIDEWLKVSPLKRKIEQKAHHQCGPEAFFGRVDTALDEKGRSHAKRDV
jgi:hypothetical protein